MPSVKSVKFNLQQNDKKLLKFAKDGLVGANAQMSIAMILKMPGEEQH